MILFVGAVAVIVVIALAIWLSARTAHQEQRPRRHRRQRWGDPFQTDGYEVQEPDDAATEALFAGVSRPPEIATEPVPAVPARDHDEYDGEFHSAPTLAGQPVQMEWFGHAHADGRILPDHLAVEAALAGAFRWALREAEKTELELRGEIAHLRDQLRWGDLAVPGYPDWPTGAFFFEDAALEAGAKA